MWVQGLAQSGLLLREALLSGLWGLQCPVHCHQPSLLAPAFFLVLGLVFGFSLSSIFWIWLLTPLAPSAPVGTPAQQVLRSVAGQARRRLEGYRQRLHEP